MRLIPNTIKGLLAHLVVMGTLTAVLLLGFFYLYLPAKTNHGETITVPELKGMNLDDVENFLTQRNLRYEVTEDSSFSADYPALTILKQDPKPGSKVKENRMIYVSINATNPPKIGMPNLIDGSIKNAKMILESYGLELGKITYVPDLAENAVLEQRYDGEEIEAGTLIHKGSKIDLVVGDGLSKQLFEAPTLNGLDLKDAEFVIKGQGLKLGSVIYVDATNEVPTPGAVARQQPAEGTKIRKGEIIDLWVVQPLEELEEEELPDLGL